MGLWLSTTATAQVLNGDIDEGRHTADDALEILSGDLDSGRVAEVFTEFCETLRTHNTHDAAGADVADHRSGHHSQGTY